MAPADTAVKAAARGKAGTFGVCVRERGRREEEQAVRAQQGFGGRVVTAG